MNVGPQPLSDMPLVSDRCEPDAARATDPRGDGSVSPLARAVEELSRILSHDGMGTIAHLNGGKIDPALMEIVDRTLSEIEEYVPADKTANEIFRIIRLSMPWLGNNEASITILLTLLALMVSIYAAIAADESASEAHKDAMRQTAQLAALATAVQHQADADLALARVHGSGPGTATPEKALKSSQDEIASRNRGS